MKHLPSLVQRHRKGATWLMLGLLGALTLVTDSAWPRHHAFHEAAEKLALLFLVAGVLVRVIASAFVGGRKNAQVMDMGPYSLTRNPLYVGSLLIATAAGLSFGSVLLALMYCLAAWILFTNLIVAEERDLLARFGHEFAQYAARTPRWIPRSLHWSAPATLLIDLRAVSVAVREGIAFFLLVPVQEAIESAHAAGLLPVLLRLY